MKKPTKHTSALQERDGVLQPPSINPNVSNKVKTIGHDKFIQEITNGNTVFLSKAITLIESVHPKHKEKANAILQGCIRVKKDTLRIGITGVPGVGKSTFIESFGSYLTSLGKKVAVLAVDPSSTITKGSILGDKTRMEELVKNKNAFIRPSPSGNSLGGVARKTRETVMLCEAAGYDVIIIETVGVGQSETVVHSMVDFFLLLKLAGAGDQLQGIKRGIIEMADAIVINKADGDNIRSAKLARTEFKRALQLYPAASSGWIPKVTTCSAIEKENIDGVWAIINDYLKHSKTNNYFKSRRIKQNKYWLIQTIEEQLKERFYSHPEIQQQLAHYVKRVEEEQISPFKAAEELLLLL